MPHPSTAAGTSQCDLILARLKRTPGEWVPMVALARTARAYAVHSRISDLRLLGHTIYHRNERTGKKVRSYYLLCL